MDRREPTLEELAHQQRDEDLKQAITDLGANLDRRLKGVEAQLENKLDPIYEIFESVSGFNKIGMWILKILAAIGAAILGVYALLEFIKKIAR